MLCPSCNTPNRDNARFCKKCGYSFTHENVVAPVADAQEAPASDQMVSPVDNSNDPSAAPTMILTPQEMVAYHTRRWQQELEKEQQSKHPGDQDIADAPTMLMSPVSASNGGEQAASDVADMPTVMMQPLTSEDAPTQIPPPPPPESLVPVANTPSSSPYADDAPTMLSVNAGSAPGTDDATVATATAPEASAQDIPKGEENVEQGTQQPLTQPSAPEVPVEPKATADFPTLAVGSLVAGRYEVTQVVSEDEQEHIYLVTDHQGYQRCWNCSSEQNAKDDEFCIDCGAELLNAIYTMHEYPAAESKNSDAHVLQGTIVNTVVDQGRTYAIEQPQSTQTSFPQGVHLVAACESDAGNVRRSEPNEDSTLVLQLQRIHESISVPSGVFIVADGLGGHDNGQVASRMTIGVIAERMVRELLGTPLVNEKAGEAPPATDEDSLITLFKGTVEEANTVLCQVNQRDKTDMGSTITGFMIVGEHAYILNVGDSRTYLLREGTLYQLTTDHSLVGQLVAGGLIEPDDVYTHPQRSQIFRSLGDKLNVQIDIFKQQVLPGDILLSCSDGLWEMVRNPQITDILSRAPDPQTASSRLIEAANNNGGEDNVSAVVVFVR